MQTEVITVRTGSRPVVLDITEQAGRFVTASGADDGLLHVFVPHATAGIAIIETGAGSDEDVLVALDALLPRDGRWTHRHGSAGHGRDHVLPVFVAPSMVVPVLGGLPALGTWQRIVLIDSNGDNPVRTVRLSFLASG